MPFIKDMYRDEIRDGWLVKSSIKKSWNRMLEMWQEIDRICRKYGISYWAHAGTLLGAVRHGGFIPWDTDFDLCMMRPEYNIFCDAVDREWTRDDSLLEVERKNFNNFRVALSTTTMLGKEDFQKMDYNKPHGMMIEVYPLDIAADNTPSGDLSELKILELLNCTDDSEYSSLKERAEKGQKLFNDWRILENFHSLKEKDKQDFYRKYTALLFDKSNAVRWIEDTIKSPQKIYTKEMFRETIYLPFESIELPVPVDYEKMLTALYGDWHKFVYDRTFRMGSIYSPDIPYRKLLERVDLEFMFPPEEEDTKNKEED